LISYLRIGDFRQFEEVNNLTLIKQIQSLNELFNFSKIYHMKDTRVVRDMGELKKKLFRTKKIEREQPDFSREAKLSKIENIFQQYAMRFIKLATKAELKGVERELA